MRPVAGSSDPSFPLPWAVYHTDPSADGATSWGREPRGTAKVRTSPGATTRPGAATVAVVPAGPSVAEGDALGASSDEDDPHAAATRRRATATTFRELRAFDRALSASIAQGSEERLTAQNGSDGASACLVAPPVGSRR